MGGPGPICGRGQNLDVLTSRAMAPAILDVNRCREDPRPSPTQQLEGMPPICSARGWGWVVVPGSLRITKPAKKTLGPHSARLATRDFKELNRARLCTCQPGRVDRHHSLSLQSGVPAFSCLPSRTGRGSSSPRPRGRSHACASLPVYPANLRGRCKASVCLSLSPPTPVPSEA